MRVLYIDSLFLINFTVNYLITLATAKICALSVRRYRLALAALLGAAYAVLTVLPGLAFTQSPPVRLAAGVLLLLAAFGGQKGLLRAGLVFFAAAAAFAGVVLAVSMLGGEVMAGGGLYVPLSFRALLLSVGLGYGLLTLLFQFAAARRGRGGVSKLRIRRGVRVVELSALRDTGNSLRDPLSGLPVPIAEYESLKPLLSEEENALFARTKDKSAAERLEALFARSPADAAKFRLLSYSAVGVERGLLLAFRPDSVAVDGKETEGLWVAISPTKLSGGGCSAILNGM